MDRAPAETWVQLPETVVCASSSENTKGKGRSLLRLWQPSPGKRSRREKSELHKTDLGLELEGAELSIIQPLRSRFWL